MLGHMLNNTGGLLYTWFTRDAATHPPAVVAPVSLVAMSAQVAAAAGVLILCCMYIRFRVRLPAMDEAAVTHSGV
jgi:hypothetical protein